MKKQLKWFPVLLAFSVVLALTGCGGPAVASSNPASPAVSASSQPVEKTASPAVSSESLPDTSGATSLVVYFSWSGNTEQMAGWVADESGSDLYRITPKEAYGEDFDSCADRAKNELDNGIRPQLTDLMDAQTMAQYDTVYVGFPIWWYDLPMAMTAFLENYDLSGKTIVPFFSHNGSSSGAAAPETLAKICTGATVLTDQALSISGNSVKSAEAQVREWVGGVKQ